VFFFSLLKLMLGLYSLCLQIGRSQWSRDLRHEMSAFARTLGSLVRIPLKAWMCVGVYSVFVLGSGLATN
jgi:DNA-binding transcriptional regulator of glucitol operon